MAGVLLGIPVLTRRNLVKGIDDFLNDISELIELRDWQIKILNIEKYKFFSFEFGFWGMRINFFFSRKRGKIQKMFLFIDSISMEFEKFFECFQMRKGWIVKTLEMTEIGLIQTKIEQINIKKVSDIRKSPFCFVFSK